MNLTFATLIGTFFNVGKAAKAPGTWGSLATFPFLWGLMLLLNPLFQAFPEQAAGLVLLFGIVLMILLWAYGVKASNIYMKHHGNHDPKEIVIDEVLGQTMTVFFTLPLLAFFYNDYSEAGQMGCVIYMALCFIAFRFFDIVKPWPIRLADQYVEGGIGVMLDDVIAAIFAVILVYLMVGIILITPAAPYFIGHIS